MITKMFHLGKKPYAFQIDDDTDIVLIGKSEWDEGLQSCRLTLMFSVFNAGEAISMPELNERARVLGSYINRSGKFNSGQFDDFDAQRYITSRYRDIMRRASVNRRSGSEVLRVLTEYADEYQRQGQRESDHSTSAEVAALQVQEQENEEYDYKGFREKRVTGPIEL